METLILSNQTLAVLSNKTMNRARVIAERTGSNIMGLIKAQMISELKARMALEPTKFIAKKKDGSIREFWGVTTPKLMKATQTGTGYSGDEVNTVKFWDIEKGGYRSVRFENIIQIM